MICRLSYKSLDFGVDLGCLLLLALVGKLCPLLEFEESAAVHRYPADVSNVCVVTLFKLPEAELVVQKFNDLLSKVA